MTENETAADAPDFDLDAWLAGATVAQASVDILQRPDLLARYDEWERRYERAQQIAKANPDAGLDEDDPLAEIEAEGEALYEEIAASRATWYVRGLGSEDADAITAAFPEPEKPPVFDKPLPKETTRPTEAQAKAYLTAWKAWEIAHDRFNAEHKAEQDAWSKAAAKVLVQRGAETIVRALDRIEVGGRVIATSISHEQALALPGKIGDVQVQRIIDAIREVGEAEPEVPAAFLSRTSASTQE